MRFTSSAQHMKGLCWKGSLGLFNQFHSPLQWREKKKNQKLPKPPNKPNFFFPGRRWCSENPSSGCELGRGALEPYVHNLRMPSPLSPLPPGLKLHQTQHHAASVLLFNIWDGDCWGGGSCLALQRALDRRAAPWALQGLFVPLAGVQMRIRRGPSGAVERMVATF